MLGEPGCAFENRQRAKISTLGPLTENYIEITTGSEQAALAPAGATLLSAEAFGLPQLGDAVQAMLPDVQKALQKLNQNLDGLQVTLTEPMTCSTIAIARTSPVR